MEYSQRGFAIHTFLDRNGIECSIQKSSIATEDCIWLGVNKTDLTVFENEYHGKYIVTPMPYNFMVNTRMHLNRQQAKMLLPMLQKFAETGEIDG
jgi:hypothetical protein